MEARSNKESHEKGTVVRQGKGNKDRFAPIGERALAWIDKYLLESRPHLLSDPTQPLLFVTGTGRPMHPNDLSSRVRRCMKAAGVGGDRTQTPRFFRFEELRNRLS